MLLGMLLSFEAPYSECCSVLRPPEVATQHDGLREHLQLVSSINFAKKKKVKNISLTYSQVLLLMHASFHSQN
jgi:hypothetical protein